MFAYSMASAQLGLKHVLLRDLMTGCMVGWPKDDATASAAALRHEIVDDVLQSSSCFLSPLVPPVFLHYCQHYSSFHGRQFGKRAVPHGILDCEHRASLSSHQKLALSNSLKDHATGAMKNSASINWNALAYCAINRGINYARKQVCDFFDIAPSTGPGPELVTGLRR